MRNTPAQQRRLDELAQQVLPIVRNNPQLAFPMGVGRLLRQASHVQQCYTFETRVGEALRLLQQRGLLTSTIKARHPEQRSGRVRLYAITPLGLKTLEQQTLIAA